MKTIFTIEDLYTIQSLLDNNGYGEIPMKIQIDVLTRERLKQINETFFSQNPDKEGKIDDDFDQINVKVGNIIFQYKLVENHEY